MDDEIGRIVRNQKKKIHADCQSIENIKTNKKINKCRYNEKSK